MLSSVSVSKAQDEQYSEQEAAQRRDAVLKRMLNTPPQPHTKKTAPKRRSKKTK